MYNDRFIKFLKLGNIDAERPRCRRERDDITDAIFKNEILLGYI